MVSLGSVITLSANEAATTEYQWDAAVAGAWSSYVTALSAPAGQHTLVLSLHGRRRQHRGHEDPDSQGGQRRAISSNDLVRLASQPGRAKFVGERDVRLRRDR